MTLSQDDFESQCCETTPAPTSAPSTCATYSAAWAISQLLGAGCAADTQFFDLNKSTAEVASPQSEDDIKAACCTDFADATCADWVLMTCTSGQYVVGTNAAPADGDDGMTIGTTSFVSSCCSDPISCADFGDGDDDDGEEVSTASAVSASIAAASVAFTATMWA